MWLQFAVVALVACIVTIALIPLVRYVAFRIDAVDYPSERRVNRIPIARLGGVAMFCGLVAALFAIYIGVNFFGWRFGFLSPLGERFFYPGIAAGVFLVFAVGVIDDIMDLKPIVKLAGQIVAASIIAASGLLLDDMHNPFGSGYIFFGWFAYPLTVFYLVAFTNIINLIDGLDGLASGITAIAAFTIFIFATITMRIDAALLCAALVGICVGFLRYNFYPASIFMGDSGSLLLGFGLGTISLLNVSRTAALTSLIIPLIVAGVPIIDTFSAIVRRKRAHISIGQADKGHIHHRLIQEGYNQKQAVLLIYAWCIMLSAGAAAINQVEVPMRVLIFTVLAIGSAAFAKHLHLFEPVLRHHYNKRTHEDELVTPDDPAFKQEEQAAEERKEERHHRR